MAAPVPAAAPAPVAAAFQWAGLTNAQLRLQMARRHHRARSFQVIIRGGGEDSTADNKDVKVQKYNNEIILTFNQPVGAVRHKHCTKTRHSLGKTGHYLKISQAGQTQLDSASAKYTHKALDMPVSRISVSLVKNHEFADLVYGTPSKDKWEITMDFYLV